MSEPTFENCTTRILHKDGSLEIKCNRGLFGVRAMNHNFTNLEARRYWIQYFQDGEYNKPHPERTGKEV